MIRTLFYAYLSIDKVRCGSARCSTVLIVKTFYHQIVANVLYKASDLVKFLKVCEIWVSLKKERWLFLKCCYNMEGKSSTRRERFSYVYLPFIRAEWESARF